MTGELMGDNERDQGSWERRKKGREEDVATGGKAAFVSSAEGRPDVICWLYTDYRLWNCQDYTPGSGYLYLGTL